MVVHIYNPNTFEMEAKSLDDETPKQILARVCQQKKPNRNCTTWKALQQDYTLCHCCDPNAYHLHKSPCDKHRLPIKENPSKRK